MENLTAIKTNTNSDYKEEVICHTRKDRVKILKRIDNAGNDKYYNEDGHALSVAEDEPSFIAACLLENFDLHVDYLLDRAINDPSLLPIANNLRIILKNAKQKFDELFAVIDRDLGYVNIKMTHYNDCAQEDDIFLEAFIKNLEH